MMKYIIIICSFSIFSYCSVVSSYPIKNLESDNKYDLFVIDSELDLNQVNDFYAPWIMKGIKERWVNSFQNSLHEKKSEFKNRVRIVSKVKTKYKTGIAELLTNAILHGLTFTIFDNPLYENYENEIKVILEDDTIFQKSYSYVLPLQSSLGISFLFNYDKMREEDYKERLITNNGVETKKELYYFIIENCFSNLNKNLKPDFCRLLKAKTQ
jgi:hypothetical protein